MKPSLYFFVVENLTDPFIYIGQFNSLIEAYDSVKNEMDHWTHGSPAIIMSESQLLNLGTQAVKAINDIKYRAY